LSTTAGVTTITNIAGTSDPLNLSTDATLSLYGLDPPKVWGIQDIVLDTAEVVVQHPPIITRWAWRSGGHNKERGKERRAD